MPAADPPSRPGPHASRPATGADVPEVVAVHLAAFGGSFLARLGPRFLRLYYRALLRTPGGVLLVAGDGPDGVAGFAAGSVAPDEIGPELRRHPLALARALVAGIVRDPLLVPSTLRNIRRMQGSEGHEAPEGTAELTSIAAHPDHWGSGLAGELLAGFEDACREAGCDAVELTTDARDNVRAITFYRRRDYRPVAFVSGRGRPVVLLRKALGDVPDGQGRWYRAAFVLNKAISASDYRHLFSRRSAQCEVTFALPGAGTPDLPGRDLPIHEGARPADLWHLVAYVRAVRRGPEAVQLLHFFAFKLVAVGPLVAHVHGIPCVVTVTGLGRVFSSTSPTAAVARRLLVIPLLRRSLPLASRVLFQSETDRRTLEAAVPAIAGRSVLIRSAAELATVEGADDTPAWDLLWVSRLMASKGGRDVLALAERLAGGPPTLGVLGPDAEGEAELAEAFASAARRGVLDHRGEVPASVVAAAYRATKVVLFLSVYGEGVPRVLVEAGLARRAVVAYDTPLTRELLGDGRGVLVPAGDVRALEAAARALVDDPTRRDELGGCLEAFVHREFDVDAYVRRLDEIMADAVAPGIGAAPLRPHQADSGGAPPVT